MVSGTWNSVKLRTFQFFPIISKVSLSPRVSTVWILDRHLLLLCLLTGPASFYWKLAGVQTYHFRATNFALCPGVCPCWCGHDLRKLMP